MKLFMAHQVTTAVPLGLNPMQFAEVSVFCTIQDWHLAATTRADIANHNDGSTDDAHRKSAL